MFSQISRETLLRVMSARGWKVENCFFVLFALLLLRSYLKSGKFVFFSRSGVKSCHATFSLHKSDETAGDGGEGNERSFECASRVGGGGDKRAEKAKNKKVFNNSARLFSPNLGAGGVEQSESHTRVGEKPFCGKQTTLCR
jgi:hypothetical protein